MMKFCALAASATVAMAHGSAEEFPVNPALNVPGFPDCVIDGDLVAAGASPEMALRCTQKQKDNGAQIAIGTIGDSITAGVHSTGGNHTYPGQLQIMLGDKYKVTNLGACGSTYAISHPRPRPLPGRVDAAQERALPDED